MLTRRRFIASSIAGAAALAARPSGTLAQTGTKTLRIVVGFPPGGGTDVIARLIGEKLRGSFAPAVMVENRVGASGRIAVDLVRSSEADGHTLLFTPDFLMTVYPHSFKKLAYDPLRDFAPVATASRSTLAISAGPGLPPTVQTIRQYVEWARQNTKLASYATTSAGATPHFVGVMLSRAANVELTAVHYKGGAPALQDLLGGQIPISINPVGEILPFARSGKIRVLATTGALRSRFLPDTPTMLEAGINDIVVEAWLGFFAPAKTPAAVVANLNSAISEAVKSTDVIESFAKFGVEAATAASPAAFAALVRADIERWGPIVKASGFTAEE